MSETKLVVILFGPPGAGKGAITTLLEGEFGFTAISTSELLSKYFPDETGPVMAAGGVAADSLVMRAIEFELAELKRQGKNLEQVVIDTPRSVIQIRRMKRLFLGARFLTFCLLAREETIEGRIKHRSQIAPRPDDGKFLRRFSEWQQYSPPMFPALRGVTNFELIDADLSPFKKVADQIIGLCSKHGIKPKPKPMYPRPPVPAQELTVPHWLQEGAINSPLTDH